MTPFAAALFLSLQAGGAIVIPKVRLTADYDLNKQAAAHHGPMIDGDIAAAPYLRHKEHLDMYDEHQAAEYDADEDDIAWLDGINSKVCWAHVGVGPVDTLPCPRLTDAGSRLGSRVCKGQSLCYVYLVLYWLVCAWPVTHTC